MATIPLSEIHPDFIPGGRHSNLTGLLRIIANNTDDECASIANKILSGGREHAWATKVLADALEEKGDRTLTKEGLEACRGEHKPEVDFMTWCLHNAMHHPGSYNRQAQLSANRHVADILDNFQRPALAQHIRRRLPSERVGNKPDTGWHVLGLKQSRNIFIHHVDGDGHILEWNIGKSPSDQHFENTMQQLQKEIGEEPTRMARHYNLIDKMYPQPQDTKLQAHLDRVHADPNSVQNKSALGKHLTEKGMPVTGGILARPQSDVPATASPIASAAYSSPYGFHSWVTTFQDGPKQYSTIYMRHHRGARSAQLTKFATSDPEVVKRFTEEHTPVDVAEHEKLLASIGQGKKKMARDVMGNYLPDIRRFEVVYPGGDNSIHHPNHNGFQEALKNWLMDCSRNRLMGVFEDGSKKELLSGMLDHDNISDNFYQRHLTPENQLRSDHSPTAFLNQAVDPMDDFAHPIHHYRHLAMAVKHLVDNPHPDRNLMLQQYLNTGETTPLYAASDHMEENHNQKIAQRIRAHLDAATGRKV